MKRMTEKVLIKTDPALKNRLYQVESLMNILNLESEKCLVKMFCGTGKSRIITNVIIHEKKTLNVIVFPSLALINQYSMDYLNNDEYKKHFKKHKKINVSSEILTTTESTTDPKKIKNFLKLKTHKIILVTYQSYQVLLNCLDGMKIGLVCYDEAHHVVSPEYQKLVFETDYFEKEVFFTATPRNENGIIMYDVDEPENNMCGELAYDYTYLQGLNDEVLNSFEVCIDMYTENSNNSIYQALARAILARNTSRVLSFHSGVNGESNTNVWNFVNFEIFQAVFYEVQRNEFPEKEGYYTKITFKGIDAKIPSSVRKAMLLELDETPDNEIYIISSCETIGEGVDTKNANMCLFADPKTSVVKIIQNIGRVVRRNKNHPLSTVLIPCWINMENYAEANGDTEKQDELIRQQMRMPNGDYASILNVLGALKQEDPELYEMCLNNHSNRRHKEKSLEKQKFQILDDEEDEFYETYDSEEVQQMKEEGEIPLEIHTNETIERFNEDVDDELLLRLYHDEENNIYKPIIRTDEEVDDRQIIQPPTKATSNVKMSIHQNDDIQMLWSVSSELDFSKKFCSAIIACEVSYGVEQWFLTHEKVCEYIDDEKKAPSQKDKNPEIKKLGKWVSHQKENYAKNRYIMKNPEIRTKWEETLEKYKKYLKQEIIPIQSDEQKPEEKIIIKIKNKKKIIKKQKTIIPTSSNADISTIENQTTHHFPQQPSDIGQLHKTYLRMRSDKLHQKFKENPKLWKKYHAIRKKTFAHYDHDSIPSNIIIRKLEKIKTKHKKIVVDMGCGQAPIAHHFLEKNDPRFTFHNYDHISGGDTIIQEVNISHLTEDDSSVDIAIMSLALWGTQEDCTQYIKEAYRILESGGKFYICDSTKKWSFELMTQENGGELLRKMLMENGFTIIHEEIGNPFCLFECYKNY